MKEQMKHLVPLPETCAQMKEKGFPQNTEYSYIDRSKPIKPNVAYYGRVDLEQTTIASATTWSGSAWPVFAAPTFQETLEELPYGTRLIKQKSDEKFDIVAVYSIKAEPRTLWDLNPAEAAAQLWLELQENPTKEEEG